MFCSFFVEKIYRYILFVRCSLSRNSTIRQFYLFCCSFLCTIRFYLFIKTQSIYRWMAWFLWEGLLKWRCNQGVWLTNLVKTPDILWHATYCIQDCKLSLLVIPGKNGIRKRVMFTSCLWYCAVRVTIITRCPPIIKPQFFVNSLHGFSPFKHAICLRRSNQHNYWDVCVWRGHVIGGFEQMEKNKWSFQK